MICLSRPSSSRLSQFINRERNRPFTYFHVAKTREEFTAPGFDNDFNFIELGSGEIVWKAAVQAIRAWQMFPGGWASIEPNTPPVEPGVTVAMLARIWGLWWVNSCRIVYIVKEENRFGFAYGTLPGHAECGEELFLVERLSDGSVRYVLKAFSKPRHLLARVAYPLARHFQRKFVQESKNSMLRFVQNYTP